MGEYEDYLEDKELAGQNKFYIDEKQFFSEFLFNPDINENSDYRHIDKNLAITRLSSRFKEPEQARAILKALHTLSNPKYFYADEEDVLIGYRDEKVVVPDEEGRPVEMIKKIPVHKKRKVMKSYYPKTYHNLKAKFYALTTTAMARDGHLLRRAGTRSIEKSEAIEDRTSKKSGFFGFNNSNNNNNRGEY